MDPGILMEADDTRGVYHTVILPSGTLLGNLSS